MKTGGETFENLESPPFAITLLGVEDVGKNFQAS